MAKTKAKAANGNSAAASDLPPEIFKKLTELKAEGNNSFARGDYTHAISVYEKAISFLPEDASEKAELYNNKAACYYGLRKYKDAVRECTTALEKQPGYLRAAARRAKAYEQQGFYKQALADLVSVNRSPESSTEDSRVAEKRVRELLSKKSGGGGGSLSTANGTAGSGSAYGSRSAASSSSSAQHAAQQQPAPHQVLFSAKCSLGDDTKLVHLTPSSTYAELLGSVASKFPTIGPFVLKYLDKDGDQVTITQRADIHSALSELVTAYQKAAAAGTAHGPKLNSIPPLKLIVSPVASEAEVPAPPADEELERQQQLAMQRVKLAALKQREAEAQAALAPPPPPQPVEEYQADSWLLNFLALFRDTTGINPEAHLDAHNVGWEALHKAMETAVHSPEAEPLFARAKDSFLEVTCTGLLNLGTVHTFAVTRMLDNANKAGKPFSELESAIAVEQAEAEKRFQEALSFKPTFFEGLCAMAQLEFERAKLKSGFWLPAIPHEEPPADAPKEGAATAPSPETQAVVKAATKEALAKLKPELVTSAKGHVDKALSWIDKAVELAPAQEAHMTAEREAIAASRGQEPLPAPEYSLVEQAQVSKGNFLFEWSQLLSTTPDGDWRGVLDEAAALFRAAHCPEKDVRAALMGHVRSEELDLGPEPEPEVKPDVTSTGAAAATPAADAAAVPAAPASPAAAPAAASAPSTPEAKGLPSLPAKKNKKGGSETASPSQ